MGQGPCPAVWLGLPQNYLSLPSLQTFEAVHILEERTEAQRG